MEIGRELLYLSKADVEKAGLGMAECIALMEAAYTAKSDGMVELPEKPMLGDPYKGGFLEAFPGAIKGTDQVGVKWLGGCFANPSKGLPSITGLIILNDPETQCPVAVMDCTYITGIRTAAVSGMAVRKLARENSETLGVLGSGLQARTHLEAVLCVRPGIKTVYAWGPRLQTAQKFAQEAAPSFGVEIIPVETAQQAVENADIFISSTPFGPAESFSVIGEGWYRQGVCGVAISGANHFTKEGFYSFDRYFMDDAAVYRQIAQKEGFSDAASLNPVEIGDVVAGKKPGRTNDTEKLCFNSIGLGINDMPAARLVLKRALEQGIGTLLPL